MANYIYHSGEYSLTTNCDSDNSLINIRNQEATLTSNIFNLDDAVKEDSLSLFDLESVPITNDDNNTYILNNQDFLKDADHAVWVTGVEQYSDNTWNIILNDSGIDSGQAKAVNYWDFMNAWDDSNNFLTIVDA
jgi:NADPH-dependent ferric siderophore reductase